MTRPAPLRRVSVSLVSMLVLMPVLAVACSDSAVDTTGATVHAVRAEGCDGERRRAVGVVVGDRMLATVAHTLADASTFEILDPTSDARSVGAELVLLDPGRDLALFRLDEPVAGATTLGAVDDGSEAELLTIDADDRVVTKPAIVVGHVDVTIDGSGRRAAVEIEADVETGDSGAPLMNADQQVVGIVFASSRTDDVGWAVAATEIEAALARAGDTPVTLSC